MILEIMICTLDEGINGVAAMLGSERPDVRYLVSWQQTHAAAVPQELIRPDVRVITLDGKGLSRNRNNALDHAVGDVLLVSDDDNELLFDGLHEAVAKFAADPDLGIGMFCIGFSRDEKMYPDCEFNLAAPPKGYYASSCEMMMRRSKVQGVVRFDEHFGLGAPVLGAGEESVLLHDALQRGIKCRYFPVPIVNVYDVTTGVRLRGDKRVVMANAAYLYIEKRHDMLMARAVLMAWRVSRSSEVGFFTALQWVRAGIEYAKQIRNH